LNPIRFWTIFIAFSVLLFGFSVDSLPSAEALKASGTYLTGTSATGTDKIVCGDRLCGESSMSTLEKILIYLDDKSKQQDSTPSQENAFGFAGVLVSSSNSDDDTKLSGVEISAEVISTGSGTASGMVDLVKEINSVSQLNANLHNLKINPSIIGIQDQQSLSVEINFSIDREITVDTVQIGAPHTASISGKLNDYSIGIFSDDRENILIENLHVEFPELNYAARNECCTLRVSTNNLHLQFNQVTYANPIQLKSVTPHQAAINFDGTIQSGRLHLPSSDLNVKTIMAVSDVIYVSQISRVNGGTISFNGPITVGYNIEDTDSKHLFGKVRLYHFTNGEWEDITLTPGLVYLDLPSSWNSQYTTVGITNGITSENTFGTFVAGIPLEN